MGLLKKLEQFLFTGKPIREYGRLGELLDSNGPGEVSALLCESSGELRLVLRACGRFELHYLAIPASPRLAARLAEIAEDIRRRLAGEGQDQGIERPDPTAIKKGGVGSDAFRERKEG